MFVEKAKKPVKPCGMYTIVRYVTSDDGEWGECACSEDHKEINLQKECLHGFTSFR